MRKDVWKITNWKYGYNVERKGATIWCTHIYFDGDMYYLFNENYDLIAILSASYVKVKGEFKNCEECKRWVHYEKREDS